MFKLQYININLMCSFFLGISPHVGTGFSHAFTHLILPILRGKALFSARPGAFGAAVLDFGSGEVRELRICGERLEGAVGAGGGRLVARKVTSFPAREGVVSIGRRDNRNLKRKLGAGSPVRSVRSLLVAMPFAPSSVLGGSGSSHDSEETT